MAGKDADLIFGLRKTKDTDLDEIVNMVEPSFKIKIAKKKKLISMHILGNKLVVFY